MFHSIPCFFFQDNLKDKITSVSILSLARLMFSFPSDSFRWFCLSPIYFQSLYFLLSLNTFLPEYVSRQYMLLSEYLPAGVFRSILFSPSPKCFSCRPVLFLNASLESIFLLHIYFPSNDFPLKLAVTLLQCLSNFMSRDYCAIAPLLFCYSLPYDPYVMYWWWFCFRRKSLLLTMIGPIRMLLSVVRNLLLLVLTGVLQLFCSNHCTIDVIYITAQWLFQSCSLCRSKTCDYSIQ